MCLLRDRSGVTLIETIMVITLLAAASATSLVLFDGQWVARREVNTVTNDVANSLVTARNTAVNSQSIVRVRRGRNGPVQQLQITEEAGPYRAGNTWTVDLGDDVRLRGAPREIQFRPDGSAHRNVNWIIRNSRTRGRVLVTPTDGKVTRQLP